ncbi:unnamed protein product [Cochlearia groenlandica]
MSIQTVLVNGIPLDPKAYLTAPPNLVVNVGGCKFSEEEERTVIELQSKLGNKWAKIATSLTGRTDNDVKNFWSRRQKKLSRILLKPSSSSYVAASKGKTVKSLSSSGFFEEEITNNVVVDEALKLPEPSIDVDPRYVSYHEEPCVFLNVFKHQSNNYVLM